jgi:hypothetical protein
VSITIADTAANLSTNINSMVLRCFTWVGAKDQVYLR